jgi:hypothetical protein
VSQPDSTTPALQGLLARLDLVESRLRIAELAHRYARYADERNVATYCRAEHEDGRSWIVMVMRYEDSCVRVGGDWYFQTREVRHWYSSDILSRPGQPQLQAWPGHEHHFPVLPGTFQTWNDFWERAPEGTVLRLTSTP